MNKTPLELFNEVKDYLSEEWNDINDLDIIENALKGLEIIRKHKLLNYVIKNRKCANMYHITDEEIKMLKGVIK